MRKILVISPSGEVYDHDCVRWYKELSFELYPEHYHNIGDAFVFDSSLKLLSYDIVEALNIRDASDSDIERYNAEFDYAFLRGSNYLHSEMDWENAPSILARLRIPIIALGIGAQASSKRELHLSSSTKRVLAIIADKSVSLGVRGSYTADVLWSVGVRNVRIVACPTIFRRNDPFLRINLPELKTIRHIGYTLRREVDATYAEDTKRYLGLQRETILSLDSQYSVDIIAQGEIEEKSIVWGNLLQKTCAIERLRKEDWLTGEKDRLEEVYSSNLFYSDSVAEFEAKIMSKDLVLGFRLHGNLLGLANRVPAIYFTYDSRTAEFAETLQIPSFDVFSGRKFQIEDYWSQSLFEKFNRAYHQTYRSMKSFLDENGISNRMHGTNAVQSAQGGV